MDEPETTASLGRRYFDAAGSATLRVLDSGRDAARVEGLAVALGDYADREIEAWRSRPDSPKGVACRSGCSACCHGPVGVAIPEVILIGNALRAESPLDDLAATLARARRAEAARFGLVGAARDRLRHPCPLLDEADGSCSVHDLRPLNCRGWNSLDASPCFAYFDDPSMTSTIPIDGVQRTIGLALAEGMRDALSARRLEHRPVELAIALRIILEDPTAADRWLAGEPAFFEAEMAAEGP